MNRPRHHQRGHGHGVRAVARGRASARPRPGGVREWASCWL